MYKLFFVFFWTFLINSADYDTTPYKLIDYNDIIDLVNIINKDNQYQSFIRIQNVFEKYPMINAPQCKNKNCQSYLIEMTDFEKGQEYINSLPTVLIIAGFHGNEVVGTNTIYYFLQTLIKNYQKFDYFQTFIQNVRLLLLPTANVQGFFNLRREEFKDGKYLDPNRDFPFNLQPDQSCFETTTAQIIDQIFRNNLIVSCVTFHGGDNSITYPWGNFAHKNDPITGDDLAFKQIATNLSQLTGSNKDLNIKQYELGTMQDIVYDVYGGFEDWAYGASWDINNVSKQCNIGYQDSQTKYDDQTNRALVYLIEAGFEKIPKENTLGNEISIYNPQHNQSINGHVTRNIKLIKSLIDLTYPNISFTTIELKGDIQIELQLRGCTRLTQFNTIGIQGQVQVDNEKSYENIFQVYVNIPLDDQNDIGQIGFEFSCDQQWKQQSYKQKHPQTHLFQLRTDPQYKVEYKDFTLKNQSKIQFYLLNLKLQQIDNIKSIVKINSQIYNIVYGDQLQIITEKQTQQISLQNHQIKIDSDLKVFQQLQLQNNENYYIINQSQQLSSQFYYSLIGQQVMYNNENGIIKSQSDYLFIPNNGLVSTFIDTQNKLLLTIIPLSLTKLNIEVLSQHLIDFKIKFQNIQLEFLIQQAQKYHKYYKYKTTFKTKIDDLNQYCINGAPIQIYIKQNQQPLISTLIQNNAYINDKYQIFKSLQQLSNHEDTFNNISYTIIIILLLFAFLSLYYMYKRNKQRQDIKTMCSNTNFNNDEESVISIDCNKSFS